MMHQIGKYLMIGGDPRSCWFDSVFSGQQIQLVWQFTRRYQNQTGQFCFLCTHCFDAVDKRSP